MRIKINPIDVRGIILMHCLSQIEDYQQYSAPAYWISEIGDGSSSLVSISVLPNFDEHLNTPVTSSKGFLEWSAFQWLSQSRTNLHLLI